MSISKRRSQSVVLKNLRRNATSPAFAFFRRCRVESLENRHLLSAVPTLAPIDDLTMSAGTAYYLKLDATDADVLADGSGDRLSFSAEVSDTSLTTEIPDDANNRSLRLNVESSANSIAGSMEFQLFEEIAPRTTGRIASLVEADFYAGVTFHSVIEDFVLQTGDPTGTGAGGSDLGEFDDEFGPLQMHTVPGILSMTKSSDDTNDSQFFITESPARWLDFDFTVFGYQTEGEDVREAVDGVETDDDGRPLDDVTITSAELFTDYEDGVLILCAPDDFTGDVEVTITVDDGNGGTAEQTFTVTVEADTEASNPYFDEIPPIEVTAGSSATVTLPVLDVDGGGYVFDAVVWPENEDIALTLDETTGELTVEVAEGVRGIHGIFVGVRQDDAESWDTQMVPIFVSPGIPPINIGPTGDPADPAEFLVEGTCAGAEVWIYEGDQLVGQGTAQGDTATVADTLGLSEGLHLLTAKHTYPLTATIGNNEYTATFESPLSSEFLVVVGDATPELVVTTLEDNIDLEDGETSLREAIAYAGLPGDDAITFDPELFADGPATMTLELGAIDLTAVDRGTLLIDGPGANVLTIDAGGLSGAFVVWTDVIAALEGLTITGGSAAEGGAVLNGGGAVVLDSVILAGNEATYGGGLCNVRGIATITNSTLRRNNAGSGGGILNDSGTIILNNVRLEGNTASYGGGLYTFGDATLNNTVIVGNSAQYGGGIVNNMGTTLLNASTVTANAAAVSGGGLFNNEGTLTVTNSIVALNTAIQSEANVDGDLSEDSGCNLIGADPGFAANPSAGIDGKWGTEDDDYGDLRLTLGSPAINAGDAALLPEDTADLDGDEDTTEPLPVDVDGTERVLGGRIDLGAAEFFVESDGDLTGDGTVNSADLDYIRLHWGEQVTAWDVAHGDFSGDGVVGVADLDVIVANWGRTSVPAASAAPAVYAASTASVVYAAPTASPLYGPRTPARVPASETAPDTIRALAEAAWAQAVEGLKAKSRKETHVATVDWVMAWE